MKNRKLTVAIIVMAVLLAAFFIISAVNKSKTASVGIIGGADGPTAIFITENTEGKNDMTYRQISMAEAQEIFKTEGDYIIVDVRREDEYITGHIPGAINIANESITDKEPEELPDKNQVIYVYCRSGNRSRQAAEKLSAMGYTNIIEFGGIMSWPGAIEK